MPIMIPAILLLAAQSERLPPANPLPPPGTVEAAVMAPITSLFAGMTARDPAAILAQVRADGGVTSVTERPDGGRTVRRRGWAEFANSLKSGTEKLEERLIDPAIDVDGDIAMVWSRYVFLIDGRLHHCGTDHFDLVREGGRWKVLNITWSSRTTGCDG
jgi:hypothetical protein